MVGDSDFNFDRPVLTSHSPRMTNHPLEMGMGRSFDLFKFLGFERLKIVIKFCVEVGCGSCSLCLTNLP